MIILDPKYSYIIVFRVVPAFILCFTFLLIPTQGARADTYVGGPIISDTTWTLAKSPYIVTQNIQVLAGVTLTIEPGVVVKFDQSRILQVDGQLIAVGLGNKSIIFTSSLQNPNRGDWGNIHFTDSSQDAIFDGFGNYISGSILKNCIVSWGGKEDLVIGAVVTTNASPLIDNCYITKNNTTGIYAEATIEKPIVIRNSFIYDNYIDYCYWGPKGGGIYVTYGKLTNNYIAGNTINCIGRGDGGGMYAYGSDIVGNRIFQNYVGGSGGGIVV